MKKGGCQLNLPSEIEVESLKWVDSGFSIGYWEEKPVFLVGAIPGERVLAKILKQTTNHIFARVTEITNPSQDRREGCHLFPVCGGCKYQHIHPKQEGAIKEASLRRALRDIKIDNFEFFKSPSSGYRNNVQWKLQNDQIGFYEGYSNKIIPSLNVCKLLPDELKSNINPFLKYTNHNELKLRMIDDKVYPYEYQGKETNIGKIHYFIPKNGFFQVNKFLLIPWLDWIMDKIPNQSNVLELFCGSGLIGIYSNSKINKLLGFEIHKESIDNAKINSKSNRIHNYKYQTWDLFSKKLEIDQEFDTYLLNPPRKGLGKLVIELIKQKLPKTIVYSSCDYSTFGRDIQLMISIGYQLKNLAIFDFFPRTEHFETIGVLTKIS